MSKEVWREITGWEGFYEVSNLGNVRSLDRVVRGARGATAVMRARGMKGHITKKGYEVVNLSRDNRNQTFKVHRLVLFAFSGECPDGFEACHNNGIKTDNSAENLRWDSKSANGYDQITHGNHPQARKTHCAQGHKFSEGNTYLHITHLRLHRICRTCRLQNQQKYRARKKVAV